MSTYKKLHGRAIKSVSTNLSDSDAKGQIWFNTTDNNFKTLLNSQAWFSSSPLSTARIQLSAAVGAPTTASLAFGGYTGTASNSTEEYNGSGWGAGGNLGTARYQGAGAGTQTAGLYFGGRPPGSGATTTEEYNGASWTGGGALPVAKMGLAGCGIQTAALAFGGSPPTRNTTEEYNGSAWTAGGTLSVAFEDAAGAGTQTAGLKFGGRGTPTQTTEKYNGSSWTTSGLMNTGRGYLAGAGIQTAALAFGGMTLPNTYQTATEEYDGTTWTTQTATMGTGIRQFAGNGSSTSDALAFGGESAATATLGTTEEYSKSINVITAGAWSAGGNLSTARTAIRGAGIQTAAWAVGGETGPGPTTNATENYDGSSWTAGGTFPTTTRNSFTYGTQTAGLSAGGNSAPGQTPYNTASAEYDGSSWTASPGALSPAKGFGAASGVQTSALATGGDGPPNPTSPFAQIGVQSYDGSSWSSETDYPTNIYGATGAGVSETAAVVWGGTAPYPGTPNPNTSDYNGSAWTVVAKSIVNVGASNQRDVQGTNQAPSALCGSMGGNSGAVGFYQWNDTAWSTLPNMGTGGDRGGAGTLTGAIAFGGYHPGTPRLAATEEFTPESTALNKKNISSS